MSEGEVTSLKEALYNQHAIMQNLYAELEEEREASATAASETLSMILRLQGEKAVEKMEACQYKRMAEEKMRHDEESLAIFEELLYQKEMEIASLKFQVQAFEEKMSNSGDSDTIISEIKNSGIVRRNISLPIMQLTELCSEMDNIDEEVPSTPTKNTIPINFDNFINKMNEDGDQGNAGGWHQKLSNLSEDSLLEDHNLANNELQMTMTMDFENSSEGSRYCSWYSTVSSDTSYYSTIGMAETKINLECGLSSCSQTEVLENLADFDAYGSSYLEGESIGNTTHSSSVHDIFEVTQDHSDYCHREPEKKLPLDSIFEEKGALSTPDSIQKEVMDWYLIDDEWPKKASSYAQHGNKSPTPMKCVSINHHWPSKDTKMGITFPQTDAEQLWQTDIEQLKERLKMLEDDKRIMQREDSYKGAEQLKLLQEISDQLSIIQSQIKKPEVKKCLPQDDDPVLSIMEAMLSFSI